MSRRHFPCFLAAACVLTLGVCPTQAQDQLRTFSMGMAYWPPSGPTTSDEVLRGDLGLFLENTEAVLVQVPWCPGMDASQVGWMSSVAREAQKELVIAVDWLAGDRRSVRCGESELWTFRDSTTASSYQETLARLAHLHRPEYLILGVEVDYYAVTAPDDFRHFLTTYRKTRDRIRHVAPETKVGVSLQYEHMLRVRGQARPFVREMVSTFESMSDFIGLAVYPFHALRGPDEINLEYFRPVSGLTVPLIVSETGWPGIDVGPLGVFADQGPYISRILEASNQLNATLVLWAGMRDVNMSSLDPGTPPWAALVGLWDSRRQAKPGLAVWQSWLTESRRR